MSNRAHSWGHSIRNHRATRSVVYGFQVLLEDRLTLVCTAYLSLILMLAIVGPWIIQYGYDETIVREGQILLGEGPSLSHPLGTTDRGHDVLSRLIYGIRPTTVTGLVGGGLIMFIGTVIGMTSGFKGGLVDETLMRFTDIVYGTPVVPFLLVIFALFEPGFFGIIVMIGLILWRGPARVIRSQTLQIRERAFVRSAEAYGASAPRIILKHIFPNIAPMAILYLALGIGWAIILQAGLSFIGVSDPFVPSWGVMVRNAFRSGQMSSLWWWSIPPGLLISTTVAATFLLGRRLESITGNVDDTLTPGV